MPTPFASLSRLSVLALAAGLGLAGAWVASGPALHAEGGGEKPAAVAEIKDVMAYSNQKVHGLYGLINASLKAEPSANDWKVVAARAVGMAEAGNTLMGLTPPRGAEDDAGKAKWLAHCAAFREACKELAKASRLKKYDEAKKASEAVNARCEACHADHQPE